MITSEFVHDVQSITLRRDKVNTDTYGITLVIKTESGEKTMHLFSSELIHVQDDGSARMKARWQAAAIDEWSTAITQMAEWAARKHNEDPSFPPINLQLFRELCCDMDEDAERLRQQSKEAQ